MPLYRGADLSLARTRPEQRMLLRPMRAMSRWQRKHDLTARDLLVVTVVGGLLVAVISLALTHVL